MPFLLIFIILPLAEITVFFQVWSFIGFWKTFGLLLFGAVAGGALMRYQGFQTLLSMRNALRQGREPLESLFDGFCLMAAGFLLIFPGFVSDALALFLLFPGARRFLRQSLIKHAPQSSGKDRSQRRQADFGDVIEGEYEDLDQTQTGEHLIESGDKHDGS